MTTQTISSQAPVYTAHRHHAVRRQDTSADRSNGNPQTHQSAPGSDRAETSGSFMRAVFTTFASFSTRSAKSDSDSAATEATPQSGASSTKQSSGSTVKFKEKLKLDVELRDGDVELALQVKAKVQGDAASLGDAMQAMQAFASSIFTALRSLFDGSSGLPAAQSGGTAQPTTPATTSTDQASSAATTETTSAPAAPGQSTASGATASTGTSAALNTNVKWIGSYLSVEARLRLLAQRVNNADNKDASSQGNAASAADGTVPALQQQFSDIKQQLQGGADSGLPSLADFLHALADEMRSAQSASFSLSLSLRGSFVSTSA
jgi:hypothetical protein